MDFQQFAQLAIDGTILDRAQCHQVLQTPDENLLDLMAAAYRVRRHFCGNKVHIHVLTNAKSGLCSEDCHYCSQSRVSTNEFEKYSLMSAETLLAEARRAHSAHAKRYCMVLSGRGPSDREIDRLCEVVTAIKDEMDLEICCSLGLTRADQATRLKAAGVDRINHNLNTSERFHPEICTTHTYQDRIQTLKTCREAGLELCSGGILGQGETDEDIIDFMLALRELGPDSIPINFLIPMAGTPFADRGTDLNPRRCLRIMALARLLNPDREIRIAAGREYHLRSLQALALYPANSMFVTGYLTTAGQEVPEAWQMLKDLGMEIEIDGYDSAPDEPPVMLNTGVEKPHAQIARPACGA